MTNHANPQSDASVETDETDRESPRHDPTAPDPESPEKWHIVQTFSYGEFFARIIWHEPCTLDSFELVLSNTPDGVEGPNAVRIRSIPHARLTLCIASMLMDVECTGSPEDGAVSLGILDGIGVRFPEN